MGAGSGEWVDDDGVGRITVFDSLSTSWNLEILPPLKSAVKQAGRPATPQTTSDLGNFLESFLHGCLHPRGGSKVQRRQRVLLQRGQLRFPNPNFCQNFIFRMKKKIATSKCCHNIQVAFMP